VSVRSYYRVIKELKLQVYLFQAGNQLHEVTIAICFFVFFILCMKVFVCSSWDCVLNGTPCTVVQSLEMKNLCIYTVERFLS
jgi:hypothetical protein